MENTQFRWLHNSSYEKFMDLSKISAKHDHTVFSQVILELCEIAIFDGGLALKAEFEDR